MKIQLISLLASGLMISTAMFPVIARADVTYLPPALAEVQLTPSQQTQLERLKEQTQSQLDNLLTSNQQTQFKNALSQGSDIRSAVQSLNLPLKKRRQMQKIFQTMRSQLDTILTAEQKQQIQRKRSEREQSSSDRY